MTARPAVRRLNSSNRMEVVMAVGEQEAARVGQYVDAGGVRTYYEVHGTGEPLILLHGGLCTVETFDAQTPALAERYRVYVPERRGHGRTADVDGPITYEIMAQDTIAFMEALRVSAAHLVGWSDGGNVGLLVALRRPDLVRKLVVMGAAANLEGYTPQFKSFAERMTRQTLPPMLEQMYSAVSPDGADHFASVFDKLVHLWRTEPTLSPADLEGVSAPTLVLLGDDDCLTIEHAGAMLERSRTPSSPSCRGPRTRCRWRSPSSRTA